MEGKNFFLPYLGYVSPKFGTNRMKGKTWTDEELIAAIVKGGNLRNRALYELYFLRKWREKAIAHVLKNKGNEQDGEDQAQNAFIAFERNIRKEKFRGESSLDTYFFSIIKLQWLKKLRDRKPLDELQAEHLDELEESVEEHYINEEKKHYLNIALEQIGERCKVILLMQKVGHSLAEIAQKTGLSSTTMAKKEAYRCKERFRKFIAENPIWKDLIR